MLRCDYLHKRRKGETKQTIEAEYISFCELLNAESELEVVQGSILHEYQE